MGDIDKQIGKTINQTCCFTGHRSQKLPWGFNEVDTRYLKTKRLLRDEILKAINRDYKVFISGMALGADLLCAQIVLELKIKYPDIKLVCVLPCKNQTKDWDDRQKLKYDNILNKADLTLCLHNNYSKGCMQERNRYMVNNSSLVIALFDGTKGGTADTIKYATKQKKEIVIVEPIKEDKELLDKKVLIDKTRYYLRYISGKYYIDSTDEELLEAFTYDGVESVFPFLNKK